MIKTLSPHYITTPFVSPSLGFTCARYKLEVYVWNGLKNDVPAEPNYVITKNNPTSSTGNDTINIARLINDFLTFEPLDSVGTDLVDSPNQVWIRTQVYYATTLTGDFEVQAEDINTQLAVRGYGYGNEGENPTTPANMILMPVLEYSMLNTGKFVVPIELEETIPPAPSLTIDNIVLDVDDDYTITFTPVGTYDSLYVTILDAGTDIGTVYFLAGVTSPQTITIPITGSTNVTMYGYDSLSNTNVVSNEFNIVTV